LDEYFSLTDNRMRVFWGTTQEFMAELWRRWQDEETAVTITNHEALAPAIDLMRLLNSILAAFDKEEMQTLAFELRVDYESLPERKDGFARELIVYLQNRKRLLELVDICRRERPSQEW
jgi:hypothetical protein